MFITTNEELQEMAKSAKENWVFDIETDPDGAIFRGLDVILFGDVEDSEIQDVFQKQNFPKSFDKWDALENWSRRLG